MKLNQLKNYKILSLKNLLNKLLNNLKNKSNKFNKLYPNKIKLEKISFNIMMSELSTCNKIRPNRIG